EAINQPTLMHCFDFYFGHCGSLSPDFDRLNDRFRGIIDIAEPLSARQPVRRSAFSSELEPRLPTAGSVLALAFRAQARPPARPKWTGIRRTPATGPWRGAAPAPRPPTETPAQCC